MEVHHPHHVAHKKKWTEYLLEFYALEKLITNVRLTFNRIEQT